MTQRRYVTIEIHGLEIEGKLEVEDAHLGTSTEDCTPAECDIVAWSVTDVVDIEELKGFLSERCGDEIEQALRAEA